MWRWSRRRASLVALVLAPTYLSSPAPAERMAPGWRCSVLSSAAAAGAVPIADCAGLEALPAPIVEDLSLSFEGVEAIVCEKLLTLTVESGSELSWRLGGSGSEGDEEVIGLALRLHNVRVVVGDGAKLTVGMGVEATGMDAASTEEGHGSGALTSLTLEGAAQQGSNGGALEVKHGGEAVFMVPVHFAANSVADGYSGGALHVDGEVTFTHAAHFAENRAAAAAAFGKGRSAPVSSSSVPISSVSTSSASISSVSTSSVPSPSVTPPVPSLPSSSWRHRDRDRRRPCGGGVSVGRSGRINFWEFASFEENYSAGRGGAVCNRGWAKFFRRSFFNGNQAAGGTAALVQDKDGGLVDGNGGAVCTDEGSTTTFTRRSSMLLNRASGSGGGVFNAGIMTFETSADFRGNEAAVSAAAAGASEGLEVDLEAGGGHLFNRGLLHIKGDASFREGVSGTDGGAVYAISGEDTVLGGISSFQGNTAGGVCEDIFSSVTGSEVKLTRTSTPTTSRVSAALPLPTAATDADIAAMASAVLATSSPAVLAGSTGAPPASPAASAAGVATTAPMETNASRRVSSVSRSATSSGSGVNSNRNSAPSRRRRTTPCQP